MAELAHELLASVAVNALIWAVVVYVVICSMAKLSSVAQADKLLNVLGTANRRTLN